MNQNDNVISISRNTASALFDPLELINDCRNGFRELGPYERARRRKLLVLVYIVALQLIANKGGWASFLDRCPRVIAINTGLPATLSEKSVIRFAMLFAMNATTEYTADRGRQYADALYPYLESRARAEIVEVHLKEYGIWNLVAIAEQRDRARAREMLSN